MNEKEKKLRQFILDSNIDSTYIATLKQPLYDFAEYASEAFYIGIKTALYAFDNFKSIDDQKAYVKGLDFASHYPEEQIRYMNTSNAEEIRAIILQKNISIPKACFEWYKNRLQEFALEILEDLNN